MMFDFGHPRLAKIFYRTYGLLWVAVMLWVLIFPEEKAQKAQVPARTSTTENYWIKMQKEKPRQANIPSSKYYLDDPPEAWHEADEKDDSDDPELYMDKYDGY